MDKQKIKEALITKLNRTRSFFLEIAKKYQLEAPHAIGSRSDTIKSQLEILASDTAQRSEDLKKLIIDLQQIGIKKSEHVQLGSLVQLEEDVTELYFYLVPEGAGGQDLESGGLHVQAISINSSLGEKLFLKKIGEEIEMRVMAGTRRLKILDIK